MSPLLVVQNLDLSYKVANSRVSALTDISFSLDAGSTLGIVGESGSGKSTLAMAIMGYLPGNAMVDRGEMSFGGRRFTSTLPKAMRKIHRAELAMVYQDPGQSLNPVHKIGTQLKEAYLISGKGSRNGAYQASMSALADVQIRDAAAIMNRYPHQLSGGQQQRVLIAMALLTQPRLLVLDEPTTGLDATVEAEILSLIKDIQLRKRMAVLMVSHNLKAIQRVCQEVIVMYGGEIVESGATAEVISNPVHPYTQGLLACLPDAPGDMPKRQLLPIPGMFSRKLLEKPGCRFGERCSAFIGDRCDASKISLRRWESTDRRVRCIRAGEIKPRDRTIVPAKVKAHGKPIITGNNITKIYENTSRARNERPANDLLNFAVPKGSVFAIIGESGSGKSTLSRIIAGLEMATSGQLMLLGHDVARVPVEKRGLEVQQAVQMVFQNPDESLNPFYTIGYALDRAIRKAEPGIRREDMLKRRTELLAQVRLDSSVAGQKPGQISGGQKQRVAIARAMASRTSIVIFDEPVSALDVSVQAAIMELIADMKEKTDITFIIVSHDINFVWYLSSHVAVMNGGQIVESGETAQVVLSPEQHYTKTLLRAANP
ncbi:MAG: ABC transporter ATP-binding protein [Mesorhizobium sp.]|nr:ABC transporter ATP-binding protein [Mesorhizobium sp.]